MSRDPLGYSEWPNLYAYVGNNPTTFIDPWGLKASSMLSSNTLYPPGFWPKWENTTLTAGSKPWTIQAQECVQGAGDWFINGDYSQSSNWCTIAGQVIWWEVPIYSLYADSRDAKYASENCVWNGCIADVWINIVGFIPFVWAIKNVKYADEVFDAGWQLMKNIPWSRVPKPKVDDPKLKIIIDDLYRPWAKIGNWSTADAIRYEKATWESIGNKTHSTKGQQQINALEKRLYGNWGYNASEFDKNAAKNIIQDLQNALNGN